MKKEEFEQKAKEIGQLEDPTKIRSELAELINEVGKDYDSFVNTSTENENLKKTNEDLRSANMKLFEQVGSSNTPLPKAGEPTPTEKRSFNDLFDEKGGLK